MSSSSSSLRTQSTARHGTLEKKMARLVSGWRGWRRFIPTIGYHHVLMILLAATAVAWSLLLAGCTANTGSMHNIYMLSASYATPATTSDDNAGDPSYVGFLANLTQRSRLEVRGGFFGLCVRIPTAIQGQAQWDCAPAGDLRARYGPEVDPLGLIEYVRVFADRIVFYGLILGILVLITGSFFGLASFPGWQTTVDEDGSEHEVKPFPSRAVMAGVTWALAWALALAFVSTLWIHVGATAAAESIKTNFRYFVSAGVGPAAMTLGWVAICLNAVVFIGMVTTQLSVQLLDQLVEDD